MYSNRYYLINPRQTLLDVLTDKILVWKEESERSGYDLIANYARPHIWKNEEYVDTDSDRTEFRLTYIKAVFLLNLALNRNGRLKSLFLNLFGDPMEFSVERFDHWWTIEAIRMGGTPEEIFQLATIESIDLIKATGNQEVDEYIQLKRKLKSGQNGSE